MPKPKIRGPGWFRFLIEFLKRIFPRKRVHINEDNTWHVRDKDGHVQFDMNIIGVMGVDPETGELFQLGTWQQEQIYNALATFNAGLRIFDDFYLVRIGAGILGLRNYANTLFRDFTVDHLRATNVSADQIGIGIGAPTESLEVAGNIRVTGGIEVNDSGGDNDSRVEGLTDPNLLFVDASTDRVGIGTATPGEKLEVAGNIEATGDLISGDDVIVGDDVTLQYFGRVSWPGAGYITMPNIQTLQLVADSFANIVVARTLISFKVGNISNRLRITSTLSTFATPVETPKSRLTAIGGFAVELTNQTGANTVAGQLVKADVNNNDAVVLTVPNDDECIGVFLDSGDVNGSLTWVVVGGIVDIMFDDNVTAVRGNWVGTGGGVTNGTARTQAAPPGLGVAAHFEEIGHCIETVVATGGGTHILARCVSHFN